MSENISNGISISTTCDDCIYLDNYDQLCRPCIETRESRLSVLAHELVDEDIYRYAPMYTPLLKISDNPSGSDWVASQTVTGKAGKVVKMTEIWDDQCHLVELSVKFLDPEDEYKMRNEFLPPIAQLIDGGTLDNLWELEDYTQSKRETECKWCHILTPKQFNDCQSCDLPLESNVSK